MRTRVSGARGLWCRRIGVVGVVAVAGLGACTSAPDAQTVRPGLTWVNGAPERPLDSDEWVGIVREAEFAYAWASNTADFSLPELTATWDDFTIRSFAATVQGDLLYETPHVYLGPVPIAPVAVDVSEDERSAVVAACIGARQTQPRRDDGNRWPNVAYYLVEKLDGGTHRVSSTHGPHEPHVLSDGSELTTEYCDGVTIPRAVFDPAPDLDALSAKGRDDVVLPEPTRTEES